MRIALLISLFLLLLPSGATADIICGKAWVTFPGKVWSEHVDYADRVTQQITVRKADIRSMAIIVTDQGLNPTGSISFKGLEEHIEVDTIAYFDVIRCLD